jgi:hypothetical protein
MDRQAPKEERPTMQRREGLVVRIQIKDEQGRVVGETEAVTLKGLLALAHEDGLKSVRTELVQAPTEQNGRTAIARSTVRTRRGVFTGIGDANPGNVNRRIAPHVIRMAETRATARALRLAVNIGEVSIEELGDDVEVRRAAAEPPARVERPAAPPAEDANRGDAWEPPAERPGDAPPERYRGRDDRPTEASPGDRRAMSEEQKKLLFRLAFELGETRETARDRVLRALGVERLEWATRPDASRAIDALKRELAGRSNGHGNGAAHHVS